MGRGQGLSHDIALHPGGMHRGVLNQTGVARAMSSLTQGHSSRAGARTSHGEGRSQTGSLVVIHPLPVLPIGFSAY